MSRSVASFATSHPRESAIDGAVPSPALCRFTRGTEQLRACALRCDPTTTNNGHPEHHSDQIFPDRRGERGGGSTEGPEYRHDRAAADVIR